MSSSTATDLTTVTPTSSPVPLLLGGILGAVGALVVVLIVAIVAAIIVIALKKRKKPKKISYRYIIKQYETDTTYAPTCR